MLVLVTGRAVKGPASQVPVMLRVQERLRGHPDRHVREKLRQLAIQSLARTLRTIGVEMLVRWVAISENFHTGANSE
jgi:hypothetical protein